MTPLAHDIGARLRHAREQRGLTLRDLAHQTKLSVTALRAIERNDFGALPGGLFPKAYVRMLAGELGLDANALAQEYLDQFETDIAAAPSPRGPGFLVRFLDRHPSAWPALAWLGARQKSKARP